jgi:hypothetical protein
MSYQDIVAEVRRLPRHEQLIVDDLLDKHA